MLRGAYGIYYDQPLVGIFEQNSFTTPPIVNNVTLHNAQLSNPAAGTSPTTHRGADDSVATATDFKTPRTQQWNVGVHAPGAEQGVVEVSYVGAQRRQPDSPDRHQLSAAGRCRGAAVDRAGSRQPGAAVSAATASITLRETTARSNYCDGLLTSFRYDGGRAGSLR